MWMLKESLKLFAEIAGLIIFLRILFYFREISIALFIFWIIYLVISFFGQTKVDEDLE
jgi:hypothetical protein